MSSIHVAREGKGPEVLLVHGGASPSATWAGLEVLTRRWMLVSAHRRGYPPSPPGKNDFDRDADDLEPLLATRPHVVAHSYGTLGSLIAAARRPVDVSSLTLIEPPLYDLAANDPDVMRLRRIGDAVLREGLAADPTDLREFLRLAGAEGIDEGPLPDAVARGVRRAHGGRSPAEAAPALTPIREAGVPVLVASGRHLPGLERICDALARELNSERVVAPGAGHFVARAPGFASNLDSFLASHAPEPARRPELGSSR